MILKWLGMDIVNQLKLLKLVPVVGLPSVDAGRRLAELLLRCRLGVMEITYRTDCAPAAIERITEEFPELIVIAGTVLSAEQVDHAVGCGVKGIVSPGFTRSLAGHCRRTGIPFFPGISTASEVQAAREEELFNLKFFPASLSGGVKMIDLFKAIYRDVSLMPTGGITQDNLSDYLDRENVTCCGGTWLCPEELMLRDDWQEIEKRVSSAVKLLEKRETNIQS
jgi:2-dehydro-3-deoxyphosphogluconate aldolase/(4S)-4-hydroxy-2-oxoglutarate aldolase